jgi:hypothetical protein
VNRGRRFGREPFFVLEMARGPPRRVGPRAFDAGRAFFKKGSAPRAFTHAGAARRRHDFDDATSGRAAPRSPLP